MMSFALLLVGPLLIATACWRRIVERANGLRCRPATDALFYAGLSVMAVVMLSGVGA